MPHVYLVRHGQASFGAADYDQLSPLGRQQCQALGQHLSARGLRFATVMTGTLRRQRQSLAALREGWVGEGLVAEQTWPGLNEYSSEALAQALHPDTLPDVADPQARRQHFRLLRQSLLAWMAGQIQPVGMPSHREFVAGMLAALAHCRQHGGDALLISSGGPISMLVGHLLGASPEATVELNLRLRNSAVTELVLSPQHASLLCFNSLAHLERPDRQEWISYT